MPSKIPQVSSYTQYSKFLEKLHSLIQLFGDVRLDKILFRWDNKVYLHLYTLPFSINCHKYRFHLVQQHRFGKPA